MTGTSRPGGAPFMNRLPQSVIDRYESQRKTASAKDWREVSPREHEHASGARVVRENWFTDNPSKMPPPGWYSLDANGTALTHSPTKDLAEAKRLTLRMTSKTASTGLPEEWQRHIDTFRETARDAGWDDPEGAHAGCLDAAGEFVHHLRSRGEHGAQEVFYNHHVTPPKREEAGGGDDRTLGEHVVVHTPTGHVIDWTARQFDPDADFPHVEPVATYGSRWRHPNGEGWRECAACQAEDHQIHWDMNHERQEHCPLCQ